MAGPQLEARPGVIHKYLYAETSLVSGFGNPRWLQSPFFRRVSHCATRSSHYATRSTLARSVHRTTQVVHRTAQVVQRSRRWLIDLRRPFIGLRRSSIGLRRAFKARTERSLVCARRSSLARSAQKPPAKVLGGAFRRPGALSPRPIPAFHPQEDEQDRGTRDGLGHGFCAWDTVATT